MRDPDRKPDGTIGVMVAEFRWTGLQTVVAPRIHPSRERYQWEGAAWGKLNENESLIVYDYGHFTLEGAEFVGRLMAESGFYEALFDLP